MISLPSTSILVHVVPEGQLVRTHALSTHCANWPPIQSITPEEQLPELETAVPEAAAAVAVTDTPGLLPSMVLNRVRWSILWGILAHDSLVCCGNLFALVRDGDGSECRCRRLSFVCTSSGCRGFNRGRSISSCRRCSRDCDNRILG